MAKKRAKSGRRSVSAVITVLALLLSAAFYFGWLPGTQTGGAFPPPFQSLGDDLAVHFLDVGQADCILVACGGHAMLIDAGNNDDRDVILSYLKDQGVTRLDFVIGTHPHEDHIGSLDSVISTLDLGAVILPPKAHTSKTFEDVLDAVEQKGLTLTLPVPGDKYALGGAEFTILGPVGDYGDNLNNWSVGVRITYRDTAFVLLGDAEEDAERDMVEAGYVLPADALKLGHHGSSTSSSDELLDAVKPEYAVISCGKDNPYGHPHEETLIKLKQRGIKYFRTDSRGTIVAVSDGHDITWNLAPIG